MNKIKQLSCNLLLTLLIALALLSPIIALFITEYFDQFLPLYYASPEVYWNNKIWFVKNSSYDRWHGINLNRKIELMSLGMDKKEKMKHEASFVMGNAKLKAGGDRLWIFPHFSPCKTIAGINKIGFYKNGNVTIQQFNPPLGQISQFFLYEGMPAVLEKRAEGIAFQIYHNNRWEIKKIFTFKSPANEFNDSCECCRWLDVASGESKVFLFKDAAWGLYYREGIPDSSEDASQGWKYLDKNGTPFILNDELYIFYPYLATITIVKAESASKSAFFLYHEKQDRFATILIHGDTPEKYFIVLRYDPQGTWLKILEMNNNRIIRETVYGTEPLLFGKFKLDSVYYYAKILAIMILILNLVAFAFSYIMKKDKAVTMEIQDKTVTFASIWRRSVATEIDAAILSVPLLIYHDSLKALVLLFLIEFVIISELEGRWGQSPGKWIMRIKVLTKELQPCGRWRALLRNFFKYAAVCAYGNLRVLWLICAFGNVAAFRSISYSPCWQRLGDRTAHTIVIKK